MITPTAKADDQSEELARFLKEHPDFTPVFSDNAVLCGFRVGANCLSLDNVQELFYVPPEQRLTGRRDRAVSQHVTVESRSSQPSARE